MSRIPPQQPRRGRARHNRKKRNWLRTILHLLILALAVEIVTLALTSPRFRIARIDVRGAKTIAAADVRAAARFVIGANLFLADTGRVRRSVLKIPVVKEARVGRRPMSWLVVRIKERTPCAVLHCGGKTYEIDSEGCAFREARARARKLVGIELASRGRVRLGRKPYPELVKSALDCLLEARRKEFVVKKISVDPADNMCLNMGSGLNVKLGRPIELKLKLSKLKDILIAKPEIASEALYVDLRCVTAPVWKRRQAVAPNP